MPSVAAGAIIGKGGETIAAVQKETGAKVKMSKSHDFYPGKLPQYFFFNIRVICHRHIYSSLSHFEKKNRFFFAKRRSVNE